MGTKIIVDLEWKPNNKILKTNVLQLGVVKIMNKEFETKGDE